MLEGLPEKAREALDWGWPQFEPFYQALQDRELTAENVQEWLLDWTRLDDIITEIFSRARVATTLDTNDEAARNRYTGLLDTLYPPIAEADQTLKKKLLESGLEPEGFEIPLRIIRADAELFRSENIPLETEHTKLGMAYDRIISGLTVEWNGEDVTLTQLVPMVQDEDRETRERAWRLASARVLQEREKINENWAKLIEVRRKIAANADKKDFRDYAWIAKGRFDYTPADARTFHHAIEEVVVPAAARVYDRRRQKWGVDTLRPWDVGVDVMRNIDFNGDPDNHAPIKPFADVTELEEKGQHVFNQVDPAIGEYFATMRRERLMDLANYRGKAPGAYCTSYPTEKRPFIFQNAVGSTHDVSTLLHESGHAFHNFEVFANQPIIRGYPIEFAEVASMAMELLGSPYTKGDGSFFTEEEHARVMIEHLEGLLVFWPYMAVVDVFNHWANTSDTGHDPERADNAWCNLWDRYIVGVDWDGLMEEKVTGWQRKLHIHRIPFYYIEYGLAQLGAVQIWKNAKKDQAKAVASYRAGLALGNSRTLPELYAAAGAKFAFDAGTLREAVDLIEEQIEKLSSQVSV
jgi:oligoendopeptidase F